MRRRPQREPEPHDPARAVPLDARLPCELRSHFADRPAAGFGKLLDGHRLAGCQQTHQRRYQLELVVLTDHGYAAPHLFL
ncbi:MAG TPA: hypothetical protein VKV26_08660 [Dehalococcoidia bacterium]|nr:hypothetical protein [Dehalococcoidia bacterium]